VEPKGGFIVVLETDYKAWSQRDLSAKRYVYWWADGVYFNVRLDEERTCVLVLIGATEDGSKELLAVVDGYRGSRIATLTMVFNCSGGLAYARRSHH
jgi:putative transposase